MTDENERYREEYGQVSPPLRRCHEFHSLAIRKVLEGNMF